MQEAYKEYLRAEVKSVSPIGSLIVGIVIIVFIVMTIVKGESRNLVEKHVIGPNLMYLFMAVALFLSITISYLLSRKYTWASECVTPCFLFLNILLGIPLYY